WGLSFWPFRFGLASSEPGAWGLSFWSFRLGLASSEPGTGGLTRVLSSRRSSEPPRTGGGICLPSGPYPLWDFGFRLPDSAAGTHGRFSQFHPCRGALFRGA